MLTAARRGVGWVALLTFVTTLGTVSALLLPAILGGAVDSVLGGHGSARALWSLGIVLATLVITDSFNQLAGPFATSAATSWLRNSLLRHVLALGVAGQRRFASGDLVSRLVGSGAEASAGPMLVQSALMVVSSAGGLVALWLIDWRLGATFLLGVPAGVLLMQLFLRNVTDVMTRYEEIEGAIVARLVGALAGVRTIRAAGTTGREIARVLAPVPQLARAGMDMWLGVARVIWQAALLAPVIELSVLAVAGWGVASGSVSPGELMATAGYVGLALGFMNAGGVITRLGKSRAGARRVSEVLTVPAMAHGSAGLPPGPGKLELRGVTVRGDDAQPLLNRLSLTVPAGAAVAVVGRSGAGKSTLAAVAGRLVDPDEGQVLLDGVELGSLRPEVLRREVAYAFERPALLGDTVAQLIAYGSGNHRPAAIAAMDVRQAARVAHANEFVCRLPAGYDTAAGEVPFSGGEAQRLGLARAVMQGGRLLVLDDATSSLDVLTEWQVSQAIAQTLVRTRLIVAHRAATAARADVVVWLDQGTVRAMAPHATLWADPAYRGLLQGMEVTA